MADHASSQGQVVAGEGPGAVHRFFATYQLWAENAMYDALNLRNTAPYMTP